MTIGDFYAMSSDDIHGALIADSVKDEVVDAFRLLTGEEPPSELVFRQEFGRYLRDFVATTHAVLDLISSRIVTLFADHGFTGWKVYPAEIRLRSGVVHRDHSLLVVTGRCGPIDDSKAPIRRRRQTDKGGSTERVWVGLHFDPATWDGSDLFVPQGSGFVIVTKPVRDCLVEAKVTNVDLENCAEIERMVFRTRKPRKSTGQ